jgi:hypothetical protein
MSALGLPNQSRRLWNAAGCLQFHSSVSLITVFPAGLGQGLQLPAQGLGTDNFMDRQENPINHEIP